LQRVKEDIEKLVKAEEARKRMEEEFRVKKRKNCAGRKRNSKRRKKRCAGRWRKSSASRRNRNRNARRKS